MDAPHQRRRCLVAQGWPQPAGVTGQKHFARGKKRSPHLLIRLLVGITGAKETRMTTFTHAARSSSTAGLGMCVPKGRPANGSEVNCTLIRFQREALPHRKDLLRAAFHMLGGSEHGHDVVQETLLIAWNSFHKYREGTNCRAWLFRILFNVVRHHRRDSTKWITGKDGDLSEQDRPAQVSVAQHLTDADILRALDKLPDQFRRVVLLVDVQDLTYREAGQELGIPIGTVMSRLSRGRALLRLMLQCAAQSYGVLQPSLATA